MQAGARHVRSLAADWALYMYPLSLLLLLLPTDHGQLVSSEGDEPDNYETAANTHYAANLEGKLLLIHGEMDENVHFSQTMKVVSALVEHNKDFDMLLVPNTDHSGVRGPYAIRRMWDCECLRLWAGRFCSDCVAVGRLRHPPAGRRATGAAVRDHGGGRAGRHPLA